MTRGYRIPRDLFSILFLGLTLLIPAMFLPACGSSDPESLNSGIFVDSPVQGLEFKSGSREGITDAAGKFFYGDNDTVIFRLGGIEIGRSASPKDMMSPIDLVDEIKNPFVTQENVTNICRLLQTLDDDGNPDNGILITKTVRDGIASSGISGFDFEGGFEAQADALLSQLKNSGALPDNRALVNAETAQTHFFAGLAEQNALPVVMINLGDGFTNGTQAGFGNIHQYNQATSFAAYIFYQLYNSSDPAWENPLLEIDGEQYAADKSRVFYRIENAENVLSADGTHVPYDLPTNIGVDGATLQSLVEQKTSVAVGNYSVLNELLLPIPGDGYMNQEVTQLEAAAYTAGQHPGRMKLFTLWIGMEDVMGAVIGDRSTHLTATEISAYLNDAGAGRNAADIQANFEKIIRTLSGMEGLIPLEYSYIFIATLPRVETIGALYGKKDIEAMATFEGAQVTALAENQLIGYNALMNTDGATGISIADALDTDNATLNAAIVRALQNDANFLDQTEINLVNAKIDEFNTIIKGLPARFPRDQYPEAHLYIVDLASGVFEKLPGDGIEITNDSGGETYTVYKSFGTDKRFYSPDGYYPSLIGSALIAHAFFKAVNDAAIGMAIDDYDIVTSILPMDYYNTDKDEDGFTVSPGAMTTTAGLYAPHQFDEEQVGGWIDCNDENADVLPYYVDPDSSCSSL